MTDLSLKINTFNNNIASKQQKDKKNQALKNTAIAATGTIVAWEAEPYISKGIRYPISKIVKKNFSQINNLNFMPYIKKAISQNNLKDDFQMVNLTPQNLNDIKAKFNLEASDKPIIKLIQHILKVPPIEKTLKATANGENAFFMPFKNAIFFNFEKFSAPAFHEIAHKLNSQSKNIIVKFLSNIRSPLALIGPLYILSKALTTNKEDKNNSKFSNFVKNNCGILTTATVLPLTIEECIANFKGTKIAKQAGVTGNLLDKIKLCHKMSILSYCSAAIVAGISAHLANKLRDKICSYRKTN